MQTTVAVFFGGKSNEHEISIITGVYAANLLRGAGYRVLPVFLPREGGMAYADANTVKAFTDGSVKLVPVYLNGSALFSQKKRKKLFAFDCALNCCHGGMGEDGTLSALFRWNGVRSASPETPISALFMDKSFGKIAAKGLAIPVARAVTVREGENAEAAMAAEGLTFPVIVKPVKLGSSIGVRVAHDEKELADALALAFRLDTGALVEEYFRDKRDVNCAAYRKDGRIIASECEEVFTDSAILSFEDKYEKAAKHSELPADLPREISDKIRACTTWIYEAFDGRGVVRADFIVAGGEAYFNELNTVPGSLATYLFGESLTEAKEFLSALVEEALLRGGEGKETVVTGILNSDVFRGGKGSKRRG